MNLFCFILGVDVILKICITQMVGSGSAISKLEKKNI